MTPMIETLPPCVSGWHESAPTTQRHVNLDAYYMYSIQDAHGASIVVKDADGKVLAEVKQPDWRGWSCERLGWLSRNADVTGDFWKIVR